MQLAGGGAELVRVESVGAGGAVEQEAGEVGDFRALVRGKCFAEFQDFSGFSAHDVTLAEKGKVARREVVRLREATA
jgi:hypothetical protein